MFTNIAIKKNKFLFLIFIFLCFITRMGYAQDSELTLKAHYKEKVEERIYARGNVEITYKDLKLFADEVELNTETKGVVAEGNVVIQMPREQISAEKISFNLDSTEGILQKAYGMVQPSVFYEAQSIERQEEGAYQFIKPKITSCTQAVPRWWFSGSKASFKKNDYIEMWNAVLRIKNIPVFYFPYIKFPVSEEKATGFLTPQLGYSGRKGLTFAQGFYWDIRRNMDATVNFDYYSFRGFGGGLEYRYMFPKGTGGKLNLYYFNFKPNPEEDSLTATGEEEFLNSAFIFRLKHNQPLPFDFKLIADFDYQSAFDFLREFDNNFQRALTANRSSQVHISRAWSYFNLTARLGRFETYYRLLDNTRISKSFPEIAFSSSKINIVGPVHLFFSSSFKHWEYGYQNSFTKGNQKKGEQLSFSPAITIPFTAIPWMTLNPSLSTNFIYYFQSYAPGSNTVVSEPLLQKNFAFNSELIGPVFNKIFFNKKNEPVAKHIIEPSISYRYDSPVAISDRIITRSNYFFRYHYLKYGLTNRILVKQNDMTREIFALGIDHTYYLEAEESPLQRYLVDGEIPTFSDINGYMRFYPSPKYSIDFSTRFNPYFKSFSSLRVGANLGNPNDDLFLRVNWYRSSDPYRPTYILANRHQLGVFSGVKIPSIDLEAQAEIDYNFSEKKMLYSAFAVKYHYQCIDFKADLKMFFFREKPEMQFRITFGLGHIGKTTDFLGGMGF